jgi:phosphotransferase system enzyme I (PtsI)
VTGASREQRFSATAATQRSVLGVVRVVHDRPDLDAPPHETGDARTELLRFDDALVRSREQLERIRSEASSEDAASIVGGQLNILADPEVVRGVIQRVKRQRMSALRAVDDVVGVLCQQFAGMDDEYLAAREADLQDVGDRIRKNILGISPDDLAGVDENTVLVARDLAPSTVVRLEAMEVGGLVMDAGSVTSHASILARGLGLPCMVGARGVLSEAATGDPVLVDAEAEEVILHPTPETLEARASVLQAPGVVPQERPALALETIDGESIHLRANISLGGEVRSLEAFGADGVGLFRTEMLHLGRARAPSMGQQLRAYRRVLQGAGGLPVTFRTIDAGGDKDLPFMHCEEEENPAMGLRSLRLSLRERRVFRTQLKAILKAAVHGPARLMYPMVSTVHEVRAANAVLEEVRAELREAGEEHCEDLRAGVMIEVPAAAISAELLAPEVEFFSIGTNDLLQFTFAADRGHPDLIHLLDGAHPAFLALIESVVVAGRRHEIPVSVCGEMPADPVGFVLLVGLGVRDFSMNLFAVPRIREIASKLDTRDLERLLKLDTRDLERLLEEVRHELGAAEVRQRVQEYLDRLLAG